jgi:2-amino-4-hydroxy-6-hydroxymethyldihydropteridine diphosphokinase
VRTVHVAFGSNLDPREHLRAALDELDRRTQVRGISTVHRTPALRRPDDPDFLNAVIAVRTDRGPHELKHEVLQEVEDALGRSRGSDPYEPRVVDLDLVLDGEERVDEDGLVVPDPEIYERPFVAHPLLEVAGDRWLADTGRRLAEVADELATDAMQPLPELTDRLRRRLDLATPPDAQG